MAVVRCHVAEPSKLDAVARCLVSLWATAPGAEVHVVDDGSPAPGVAAQLKAAAGELGFGFHWNPSELGLGAAANPVLERAAEAGADVAIIACDVELTRPGWLEALQAREGGERPIAVAGGRLVNASGVLDHAGLQFSLLRREFIPRFFLGPADMSEALEPTRCAVGDAFVVLRAEAIAALGTLDTGLAGQELTDYCLRAFAAGMDCVYEPAAVATRNRPVWSAPRSTDRVPGALLLAKHPEADYPSWIPKVRL
jgi:GT2 family glycosyltransferase